MNKKLSSNEIIWYILGGYFIIVGLISIPSLSALTGILFMLAGVTLLPIIYKNFNFKYKKYIRIIIPGAFYNMAMVSAVISLLISGYAEINSESALEPETTIAEEFFLEDDEPEEEQNTEIKSLHLNRSETEMEINSSEEVILEISPENFEIQDLELCSSNDDVAFLEKSERQDETGKLKLLLKSESEGECEVFVKSSNEIESNRIFVKVTDSRNYEEEDNSEFEEPPQEETAQQNEKEETSVQENYQKPQETTSQTNNSTNNKSQQNGSSQKNTNNTHGAQLYCTPKGKRYHFDPDCGGKNSRETTWAEVQAKGLTPCKKCAKK